MREKESYDALELELIVFDTADVITTSGDGPEPTDPYETPII